MKTTLVLSTLMATALAAPSAPIHPHLTPRQGNFQPFTGALAGIAATPITDSGNPDRKFQVKGDTFVNLGAALQRSCDQQFNACANKANGGDQTISVSACSQQKTQCDAAGQSASAGNQANAGAAAAPATGAPANPCNQAPAAAQPKPTPPKPTAAAAVPCNQKMRRGTRRSAASVGGNKREPAVGAPRINRFYKVD